MKKTICLLLLMAELLLAKPIVSVSIPPQAFFVEQIVGDTVDIHIVIPPNADEHHIEFKPSDMVMLEKSDLYFTIGLEFEKVLLSKFKSNFKELVFIDTQQHIDRLSFDDHHKHHDHEIVWDPHTWLDPVLVEVQADNIADALMKRYPDHATLYQENLSVFKKRLQNLHERILNIINHSKHRSFVIYHPSWTYFAKRYGLKQIPVEVDAKEPKMKDLQHLIKEVKRQKISIIFTQEGFPDRSVQVLAKECGAKIVGINHLAKDWENELLMFATQLSSQP